MKESWKFVAGLLLAAVLLWLVLRDVELPLVWASLRRSSIVGLIAAAVLNVGHNVFRVWRWGALLEPVHRKVHFRPMFVAVIVGYMTTWLVPGRLGELVRPTLLSAREDVPLGPCLGSVVADRLLDGAAIVVLFAAGIWLTVLPGAAAEHVALIRTGSLLFVVALSLFIAILLTAVAYQARLAARIERWTPLWRRLGRMFLSLSDGVRALRSPRLMAIIAAHSLLAWLSIALGTWIGVRAAGAEIPFPTMLIMLPMLALGVAVPTPGGAGSYHVAMKLGLMLFGVAEVPAVSAGILLHLAITVPVILLGLVLIWLEKLSWSDLLNAARRLRGFGADPAAAASGHRTVGQAL